MKIFIYIIFFMMFLIVSIILSAVLLRSISALISAVRCLKSKFTATSDSAQPEPIVSVADEKPVEMDTIDIEK
ncbi:MAG TPA: hypothetical protein DCS38_04940 [Ruminococcus sp.]|nr:hypothetical protein [Ruminococcus sp.]